MQPNTQTTTSADANAAQPNPTQFPNINDNSIFPPSLPRQRAAEAPPPPSLLRKKGKTQSERQLRNKQSPKADMEMADVEGTTTPNTNLPPPTIEHPNPTPNTPLATPNHAAANPAPDTTGNGNQEETDDKETDSSDGDSDNQESVYGLTPTNSELAELEFKEMAKQKAADEEARKAAKSKVVPHIPIPPAGPGKDQMGSSLIPPPPIIPPAVPINTFANIVGAAPPIPPTTQPQPHIVPPPNPPNTQNMLALSSFRLPTQTQNDENALNLTPSAQDPDPLIPSPPNGYPLICIDTHHVIYAIIRNTAHIWETEATPMEDKIVAFFHGDEPLPNANYRRGEDMSEMIRKALPHADFRISPPPLITGLTSHQRNALLNQRTLATSTRALHFSKLIPPLTDFAFFLTDYNVPADKESFIQEVYEMVTGCMTGQLQESLPAFLVKNHDALTAQLNITDPQSQFLTMIQYIFEETSIEGQWIGKGQNKRPVFAVYMPTPTLDTTKHKKWLKLVKGVSYWTTKAGMAHVVDSMNCNGCKAINHSTNSCPFLEVPGFPSFYSNLLRGTQAPQAPTPNINATPGPSTSCLLDLIPDNEKHQTAGKRGGRGRDITLSAREIQNLSSVHDPIEREGEVGTAGGSTRSLEESERDMDKHTQAPKALDTDTSWEKEIRSPNYPMPLHPTDEPDTSMALDPPNTDDREEEITQSLPDTTQVPMHKRNAKPNFKKTKANIHAFTLNMNGGGSTSTENKWRHINQITPTEERPPECGQKIQALRDKYNLIDQWRHENPTTREYTYKQAKNDEPSQSRLDRIYLQNNLAETSFEWKMEHSGIDSDHKMVSVKIEILNAPYIGKGRWALPTFILKDKDTMNKVKELGHEALTKMELVNFLNDQTIQHIHNEFKDKVKAVAREAVRKKIPKIKAQIESK
ncbi:hypothetical protein CVT24_000592 [Panaeolus cyanescens]|uniref:Endonuclease/exonuclease/phosphatase domain-containing protein n=1 Tax=Panaeolus cyanescens TaxID=181874 RepID=A0A409YY66_9AGAR|nr:hypothetical protein CVT24_000592 [Panaeolus cyanescens]